MEPPDECLRVPIAIRAYTEDHGRKPLGTRPPESEIEASPWTLVFDCETTIDATQQFRAGFYQVRDRKKLHEEGVFYDPNTMTAEEEGALRNYAQSKGISILTTKAFRSEIFLNYAYNRCGTVVGFNLPFDLSRIALDHGPARRRPMRGGFSFQLTRNPAHPRVRVKHLSPRLALIDFAKPGVHAYSTRW